MGWRTAPLTGVPVSIRSRMLIGKIGKFNAQRHDPAINRTPSRSRGMTNCSKHMSRNGPTLEFRAQANATTPSPQVAIPPTIDRVSPHRPSSRSLSQTIPYSDPLYYRRCSDQPTPNPRPYTTQCRSTCRPSPSSDLRRRRRCNPKAVTMAAPTSNNHNKTARRRAGPTCLGNTATS